jgi:ferric-dicitrate binding protein FerR (iron transport regulator)
MTLDGADWRAPLGGACSPTCDSRSPCAPQERDRRHQGGAVRAGAVLFAQAGQLVYEADALRTGADGRLGVTLKDDTRVSIGPGSEMRVDWFLYVPAEGRLGLVLSVVEIR